jgi:hypothetical protein
VRYVIYLLADVFTAWLVSVRALDARGANILFCQWRLHLGFQDGRHHFHFHIR